MKTIFISIAIFICSMAVTAQKVQCRSVKGLPDPICSPGVARTQDVKVICHGGSTKRFRPTRSQAFGLKKKVMAEYGYTKFKGIILDHVIAIEDGGDGFDIKNMYIQTLAQSRIKDRAENLIHRRICSGKITAAEGQQQLATNWKLVK